MCVYLLGEQCEKYHPTGEKIRHMVIDWNLLLNSLGLSEKAQNVRLVLGCAVTQTLSRILDVLCGQNLL